jgi:hypothetical protein
MLKTPEMYVVELRRVPMLPPPSQEEAEVRASHSRERFHLLKQLTRFGLVGGLNTLIDILVLNVLLLLWPTTSTPHMLAYTKALPTFADSLAFARKLLWPVTLSFMSSAQPDMLEIPRALFERLTETLAFAA